MTEKIQGFLTRIPRVLIYILFGSLFIRIAGFAYIFAFNGLTPFTYSDSVGYLELAHSIWDTHTFSSVVHGVYAAEIYRTPGLPALLAPFATGTFLPLALYPLIQAVLAGILLPLLTYYLAKRVVDERAAIVAAALVAFEPNLIFYTWALLTEMPFILLSLGGTCLALRGSDLRSWAHIVLGGILLGLSLYMRPGFLPVFEVVLLGTIAVTIFRSPHLARNAALVLASMFLVLSPWLVRMHHFTGAYALGGVGWRNVYTDYVASIRSVENETGFTDEKNNLKNTATEYGIPARGYNNPANSAVVRKAALSQVFAHKLTTIKLETFVLIAFFTNDNYYYLFVRHGLIPTTTGHISATYAVLTQGIQAVPILFQELARQYFIPVIGRAISFILLIAAMIGFFRTKSRLRYIFASVIILAAITSSVSGLGVQSRFRVPVMPLMFILAAPPLVSLGVFLRKRKI